MNICDLEVYLSEHDLPVAPHEWAKGWEHVLAIAFNDAAEKAKAMALEDLAPVLAAAKEIIDGCEYCQAALEGRGGGCYSPHKALRDALAEVG